MSNIFFASDHHFGHTNILTFTKSDGSLLRPGFSCVEDMNEHIIEQHNKRVRPCDKTYFLGDVCFTNKWLSLVGRMNGEKVLVKGNHDTLKPFQYLEYFKDIRACHQFSGVIMTHIPIHPDCLARWGVNIHGHLHSYKVKDQFELPDPRYYNVSMEALDNYTPVSLEEIKLKRSFLFK